MRVLAMTWIALFSARSPPRLSRWRVLWPLEAPIGLGLATAGQPGQDSVAEAGAGQAAIGVIPVAQQRAQPVGLCGGRGGQLLAGAQQDLQSFTITVRAGRGQPVDVKLQRGQYGQMRVDRIGLALAPARLTGGLFALDHPQPSRGGRAGQPGAVAAGALDADYQPRAGGMLEDT